jgi:phosphonate transport system substrate-binding protein
MVSDELRPICEKALFSAQLFGSMFSTESCRTSMPAFPFAQHPAIRALVAAGLFASTAAMAQTPTVIQVAPGDTFSAIAGRYAGGVKSWARLYDSKLSGLTNPNRITPGMKLELVNEGGRQYLRLLGSSPLAAATKPAPAATPSPAPAAAPTLAAAAPAPAPAPVAAPAADELVIGVLPNIGAAALVAQYQNLKNYLEKQGNPKVRIVVPANFKAFFDSTVKGDYDLAVAAPHFARVAQLEGGQIPLAQYEPRIAAQYITSVDNPPGSVRDLKGKAIAFANPTSLVALYGLNWLRSQGLEPGKDFEVKGARTDMGVGRMLLTGEASAAVMSNGEFRALPVEESGRLKIAEVFARIPNFIILGNPRLGKDRLARLKSQMLGFMADKEDGAAFTKATGISGINEADDATLRELDPYVAPTRRAMGLAN